MSRRNRQVAALTGLSALLAGGLIFFLQDGDDVALFSGRRRMAALQSSSDAARQLAAADLAREAEGRVLAMAGTSPPTADEGELCKCIFVHMMCNDASYSHRSLLQYRANS